ncbi:hypothetical protein PMIN07_009187 [Paraphaeosphaeria minitans]
MYNSTTFILCISKSYNTSKMSWKLNTSSTILCIASTLAAPSPTATTAPAPSFTYNATHFLLNGSPTQIIGGQMDPQRIPAPYWRDRLRKARALGLNTIFTYTFWNLLEPAPGQWDREEGKGIATFFAIAQEEDLHVVLRPGPYVCGERDWGGFPAWLATVSDMVVRSNNAPFLSAAEGKTRAFTTSYDYGSPIDEAGRTTPLYHALREVIAKYVPEGSIDGGLGWGDEGGVGAIQEPDC